MPQVKRKLNGRNKAIKRKCSLYSIGQKEQVVTYAKRHGRNKAAKHFKLDCSMVGRWIKQSWTSEIKRNSKSIGSGRTASYLKDQQKLYDWIITQRETRISCELCNFAN